MRIYTALYISLALQFVRKIAGKIMLPSALRIRPFCIAALFQVPTQQGGILAVPLFMIDTMPGPDTFSMLDLSARLMHNGIRDHMTVPFTSGVEYLGTGPWRYQYLEPFIQKGNTTFNPSFIGTIRRCVRETYKGTLA